MSQLRDLTQNTFQLRLLMLGSLAMLCISCGSGPDAPIQMDVQSSVEAAPEEMPQAAEVIAPVSVDATYADTPACNALVTRIAEEMLPCLQLVNPEYAERLQVTINNFSNISRREKGPALPDQMLIQIEEDCKYYWHSILNQLENTTPEGKCKPDAAY